jgi:hypothetical protein
VTSTETLPAANLRARIKWHPAGPVAQRFCGQECRSCGSKKPASMPSAPANVPNTPGGGARTRRTHAPLTRRMLSVIRAYMQIDVTCLGPKVLPFIQKECWIRHFHRWADWRNVQAPVFRTDLILELTADTPADRALPRRTDLSGDSTAICRDLVLIDTLDADVGPGTSPPM